VLQPKQPDSFPSTCRRIYRRYRIRRLNVVSETELELLPVSTTVHDPLAVATMRRLLADSEHLPLVS
jgi:hypothetical protein